MKRIVIVSLLTVFGAAPALAQDDVAWIGAADCRFAAPAAAVRLDPSWNDACKDGFGTGKGVLEWGERDGKRARLDATFAAGQVQGEGELHYADGALYRGTFKNGVPDGHGYLKTAGGIQFEGEFRMGQVDGAAAALYPTGNRYEGQWKHGLQDGTGVLTYVLGGRYEGGWKKGKPSGAGKIVYAGTAGRAVDVVDGQRPDRPALPQDGAAAASYIVKEDVAPVSTHIKRNVAIDIPVPPTASYGDLSAEQRASVDRWFPALAPGDEPPYPVGGPAEFYKVTSRIVGKTRTQGAIYVYVLVGADGKAVNVKAVGLDDPEVRKVVAVAAGLVKYKPARCDGQPCEMTYPYRLQLTLAN